MLVHLPDSWLAGMAVWLLLLGASFPLALKRRARRRRRQQSLRMMNLFLAVWAFAAGMTAIECYYALWFDATDSFNLSNVSQKWLAKYDRRNAHGFRDTRPFSCELPAGKKRIVFLGDSFTFGYGVKNAADRFSDRVGAALNAGEPGTWETANLALPGLETHDMVNRLRSVIVEPECRADVVVYTLCLNDILSYHGGDQEEYDRLNSFKPEFFLFRDTYFFNLLYIRIQMLRHAELHGYYSTLQQHYDGPAWERMQRSLDELRELCAAGSIDLRVAIFPFLHNLGPDYPSAAAHEKLAAYFKSQGIPVLDLRPVLEPHIAEGLTVSRFDAHPNERAHELAAEAMMKNLLSKLPTNPPQR
jgi:hypothetical protein